MKLTTTQRTLLSTALQRDDGTIALPPNLKGGAAQKVVSKLLAEKSHRRNSRARLDAGLAQG